MSVRRLAEDFFQPTKFAFTRENERWADKRIALYPAGRQQSAVIPLLMRAQDQEGWISRSVIEYVAEKLSMPYIRVLEVATFYTQFQLAPVGTRAHVQVCGTTPCMLRGAEALIEVCQHKIHHDPLTPNADGTLSWEEVECLGACVNAPMVAIFQDTFEDLTPARLDEIIDEFAAGRGDAVPVGSQNGRKASAAVTGRTTLLEPASPTREPFVSSTPVTAEQSPTAPASAPENSAAPAAPQEPTTAAKPRDVNEDSAPAFKDPGGDSKVSMEKAESERREFDRDHKADGQPNSAMREDATGAESAGGKLGRGRAPGKPKRSAPAAGALSGGTAATDADVESSTGKPDVDTQRLPRRNAKAVQKAADSIERTDNAAKTDIKPTREAGGGPEQGSEDHNRVDGQEPEDK